jgi:hypothetical protein
MLFALTVTFLLDLQQCVADLHNIVPMPEIEKVEICLEVLREAKEI